MKVGIVILNWNGLELLKRYLPRVVEHSSQHVIYLADNNSTDQSIAWTREHFPQVNLIEMKENRGYAGGYAVALKQVQEPIVCLLNSDVAVTPNWCDVIAQRFLNEPDLAACQPKIRDDQKPNYFEYAGAAGGFIDRYAYPYCRGRIFQTIEKDQGQYDQATALDWASGAALFMRSEVYNKVGGFDIDYFAHQEEIDLCWRMRLAGYKVSYEPSSVVYHLGGGTLDSLNPKKTFYNFRNSLFNIVKNDHSSSWLGVLLLRMILDGVAAFKFLIELKPKHFLAVFKAHISFYKHLSRFLKKRKQQTERLQSKSKSRLNRSIVYHYYIRGHTTFKELS